MKPGNVSIPPLFDAHSVRVIAGLSFLWFLSFCLFGNLLFPFNNSQNLQTLYDLAIFFAAFHSVAFWAISLYIFLLPKFKTVFGRLLFTFPWAPTGCVFLSLILNFIFSPMDSLKALTAPEFLRFHFYELPLKFTIFAFPLYGLLNVPTFIFAHHLIWERRKRYLELNALEINASSDQAAWFRKTQSPFRTNR